MIRKLKIKFMILSMTSLFGLLAVIIVGMNIINYNTVVKEADETLSILSRNKGEFPDFENIMEKKPPRDFSPELKYESRYFSILLTGSGDVIQVETSRIAAVDTGEAIDYAEEAMEDRNGRGFVDHFRFAVYEEGDMIRITFLDCGRKIDFFYDFLFASCGMAFAGFIIVLLVIFFFAGRIIRPISESYEKQKRFITDAGHEIKTPLTIINANVDLLEMELEENECLEDIRQQAKRLTTLTNDLVYLARMEESEKSLPMIDFPVSEVVLETAASFKALAQTQNTEFICSIQPLLSMKGNSKSIQQLVSILMDNALKYTPQGGRISLKLEKKNRTLCLTVFNTTETAITQESLGHVFERFYRTDPSRNSATGGYGIGLSVAKAIVAAHNGKIQAGSLDGRSFEIVVHFRINSEDF